MSYSRIFMKYYRIFFTSISLFILHGSVLLDNSVLAQESVPEVIVETEKRFSFVPMPFISANPTAGFLFGFTPAINFHTADPENTSMSTAIGVALVATKGQIFTSLRSNAFLKEDKWALLLDTRYNINNLPIYSFGSRVDDRESERLYFDMFRFYGTALKRHPGSRFFYGFGYLFDLMYNIEDENGTSDEGTTIHQEYQSRLGLSDLQYRQSGISLNTMYDSRDNVANPFAGSLSMISWRAFPQFLGSTANTGQLWMEHRNYFNLDPNRPRHLLAFWSYAWLTTGGDTPLLFLPGVGLDMFNRSGRPYTFGRFRGENLVYGELEWRFPLLPNKDWLGGVMFLNTTTVSSKFDQIDLFEYLQFGYGAGLRFNIIPKKRVNIGFDYGWGADGARGYFINLNEVF
jgi:outer membrane protein assembly factor BamA